MAKIAGAAADDTITVSFLVDSFSDRMIEAAGDGRDTVMAQRELRPVGPGDRDAPALDTAVS